MSVMRDEESAYANRHHQTLLRHPCPAAAGGSGGLEFNSLEITGARETRQAEVGLGQTKRLPPRIPRRLGPLGVQRRSGLTPPRADDSMLTRFGRHEDAREPFTKPVHIPANRRWRDRGQVRRKPFRQHGAVHHGRATPPSPHPHECAGQWPQVQFMDGFRLVSNLQPTTRGAPRECLFDYPAPRWVPLLAVRIELLLPDARDRGRPQDMQ
jgi:hypothetical protein